MSLKTVHLVFLASATALAVLFAIWAAMRYRDDSNAVYLAASATAAIIALALPVYGARFLRVLRGPR